MKKEVIIIITEDDDGHAKLIKKNLRRSGISNKIIHFKDGSDVIDFLFKKGESRCRDESCPYLLLLDIKMPKIDGIEVLKKLKDDPELCKLPVIIITTTDDPKEVEKCHELGCSNYVTKPIDYDKFIETIRRMGLFLSVVEIPKINTLEDIKNEERIISEYK